MKAMLHERMSEDRTRHKTVRTTHRITDRDGRNGGKGGKGGRSLSSSSSSSSSSQQPTQLLVLPMYGSLPAKAQMRVFEPPPRLTRKVCYYGMLLRYVITVCYYLHISVYTQSMSSSVKIPRSH